MLGHLGEFNDKVVVANTMFAEMFTKTRYPKK